MDMVAADGMEYLLCKLDEMKELGCVLGIEEQLQRFRRATLSASQHHWELYDQLNKADGRADELLEEIWCLYERQRSTSSPANAAVVTRFFNKLAIRVAVASRSKELIDTYRRTLEELEARNPVDGVDREAGTHVQTFRVPFGLFDRVTEPHALLKQITHNFGRDDDVERIIAQIREATNDLLLPCIVPVVGMPLIGKTTVAHMVFEHPWVKERFHERIWVHVSPLFDRKSVLRAMRNNWHHLPNEEGDDAQEFVRRRLWGKRYLLVLDDVWNEDENKWDALKQQLLSFRAHGSTIIITTRSHDVAEMMASNSVRPYELKGLSAEGCWQLFSRLLEDRNFELMQELTEDEHKHIIVKHLVGRCSGVPIRVHAVAAEIIERWSTAKKLELNHALEYMMEMTESEGRLTNECILSYKHFPIYLRNCFKFCSLFPADHNYDPEELGEIWLAERYAPPSIPNQSVKVNHPELTHFAKLWKNCFFQNSEYSFRTLITYKMHYPMHRTAINVSASREVRHILMRTGRRAERVRNPQECLHLSLLADSERKTFPRIMLSMKKLKTFILLRETEMVLSGSRCKISKIPSGLVLRLKNLCVLDLQYTMIKKIPRTIAKLCNLRYLNLSETDITFVPRFIAKLQSLMYLKLMNCRRLRKLNDAVDALVNLQKLDLAGCRCLVKVPERIDNMSKLRCLNVQDCPSLVQMPCGIRHLTNLNTLPRYIVGETEGCTISELQTLEGIEDELRIENLENVPGADAAATANLKHKTMLKSLTLQWKLNHVEKEKDNAEIHEVLEELRPNKGLIKLEIISYMGKQFPSWMSEKVPYLASLEEIRLFNLKACPTLPPLGLLPRLRVAELSGMDAITKIDDAFYGSDGTFPCLQKLTFSQMHKLERWLDVERGNMFPNLTDLTFINCPKLVALEMELPFVRELTIWLNNEGLYSSQGGLKGLRRSLKRISISLCESLVESSECKGFQELQALEELEISGCHEMRNLPIGVRHLNSIKSLTIICCNKLVTLPIWLSDEFTSLRSLSISGCNKLQSIPNGLIDRRNFFMSLKD